MVFLWKWRLKAFCCVWLIANYPSNGVTFRRTMNVLMRGFFVGYLQNIWVLVSKQRVFVLFQWILVVFFCVLRSSRQYLFFCPQSLRSQPPTARGCTVSSPTLVNAMSSGIAGTARLPATSAAPDLHTTGNPVCACGPTRSPNAGTRVRNNRTLNQLTWPIQHPYWFAVE